MSGKASLEEMAAACQDEADGIASSLRVHVEKYPDQPQTDAYRRAFVLESAANIFRIMGTYEQESRKFITGLLEEHKR